MDSEFVRIAFEHVTERIMSDDGHFHKVPQPYRLDEVQAEVFRRVMKMAKDENGQLDNSPERKMARLQVADILRELNGIPSDRRTMLHTVLESAEWI